MKGKFVLDINTLSVPGLEKMLKDIPVRAHSEFMVQDDSGFLEEIPENKLVYSVKIILSSSGEKIIEVSPRNHPELGGVAVYSSLSSYLVIRGKYMDESRDVFWDERHFCFKSQNLLKSTTQQI